MSSSIVASKSDVVDTSVDYLVSLCPDSISCLDDQSVSILQHIADENLCNFKNLRDDCTLFQQQILRSVQAAFLQHPFFIHYFYELHNTKTLSTFLKSCLVLIYEYIRHYNNDDNSLGVLFNSFINNFEYNKIFNGNMLLSINNDSNYKDNIKNNKRVCRQLFPCYQFDTSGYFKPCYYVGIVKIKNCLSQISTDTFEINLEGYGSLENCCSSLNQKVSQYGIFKVYVQNALHLMYILNQSGYLQQPLKHVDELIACSNKQLFGLRSFVSHTDINIYCPLYINKLQMILSAYNGPELFDSINHVLKVFQVGNQEQKNISFTEDQIVLLNLLLNESNNFCLF
jgi:hypothetical protein